MKMPTDNQISPCISLRGKDRPANKILHQISAVSTRKARILAVGRMTLFSAQSRIMGPNVGNSSNHRWRRGELLLKRYAASIKKGVVGSTGRNAPSVPSPSESHSKL